MRSRVRRLAVVSVACVVLVATRCAHPPTPQSPVHLRLFGSTSMEPLLRELAAAYAQRYDHVTFAFAAVGSAGGIEALRRGGADLALVSRLLQPEEEYDPASGSRTLAYTVIAQDGIAVVVNESNPVRELTRYAVRNLFGGQTLSWDEVGGPVQEVTVVSREDGSGTRAAFEATVMSGQRVTPTAVVMPSSEAVRDYVAAHVWAIGYLSMGCLGPGVAALTVDGVPPDQQSVERGTYGITRPFLLVSLDEPAVDISSFMQWARCPAAQAIVRIRYGGASSASR